MASPTFFPEGSTPSPFDPIERALKKINGALYDLVMASITFYPENSAPAPFDDPQRSLVKINALVTALGALLGGGLYNGTGSPEGVVTAAVGSIYIQTDGPAQGTIWTKVEDDGLNTGWASNS